MIELARVKATHARAAGAWPIPSLSSSGDMMALPFATASADVVTTGYGLRNVPGLEAAARRDCARAQARRAACSRSTSIARDSPPIRGRFLAYLTIVGFDAGLGAASRP